MKNVLLILSLTLCLSEAFADELYPAAQEPVPSLGDSWASTDHYVTAQYKPGATGSIGAIQAGKAVVDLGNNNLFTKDFLSFQAFLEEARRHGMQPIAFPVPFDGAIYVVFRNMNVID